MKSNYQSTPIEHLENCWPKCKMHTQERQLRPTRFLYFTTDLQRKLNRRFSKPNHNRTELEKSIPHIPDIQLKIVLAWSLPCFNPIGAILSYTFWSAPTVTKFYLITNSNFWQNMGQHKHALYSLLINTFTRLTLLFSRWSCVMTRISYSHDGPARNTFEVLIGYSHECYFINNN